MPLRVLQVHNRYRRQGGEDAVVAAEGALLRAAGHDVHTYEVQNPPQWAPAAANLARAPWNATAARAVQAAVDRFRPDVAHVHNTWFALTPAAISALHDSGVPVVMTLHNYRLICANSTLFRDGQPCESCVGTHPWHGVIHRCYNASALTSLPAAATIAYNRRRGTWQRHVDLFLALTPFGRGRFVAGGLPMERIRVKPHFVADPGPRDQAPSASRDILYVGRLAPEKGIETLISAVSEAADLRLVVIGDGELRRPLQQQAGDNVRFTGQLPPGEVRRHMLRARALAFPSVCYETFGLVLVEAMAAGLPLLASDLGGTPDIIGQAAGKLLPPGHHVAWASALGDLTDAMVDAAGLAGRARWRDSYSPAAALPMLEDSYRWAMDNHHGTRTAP